MTREPRSPTPPPHIIPNHSPCQPTVFPTTSVFSGEVKDDRPPSGNHVAAASAAAASVRSLREEDEDGDPSTEGFTLAWLRDYKRGMEYEVYSLALYVSEESCLWGLTFSRCGTREEKGAIRWLRSLALSRFGWLGHMCSRRFPSACFGPTPARRVRVPAGSLEHPRMQAEGHAPIPCVRSGT